MHTLLFAIAVIVILALSAIGAVVASVIVAQNWRIIVYVAVAMVMVAGLSASCHYLGT